MNTVVIACKTIEDELTYAMREAGVSYRVIWLEQGLHNVPEQLRRELQTAIDQSGAERILLAMGFCGNALQGLKITVPELVFPRVDDCISLLLGSVTQRLDVSEQYAAYFFTEGWLRGERNIWVEHEYMLEKYGEEITEELEKSMFGHYRTLGLLDCGFQPVQSLVDETKKIADALHLKQQVIPATVGYLIELLTGPLPEDRFVSMKKDSEITADELTVP